MVCRAPDQTSSLSSSSAAAAAAAWELRIKHAARSTKAVVYGRVSPMFKQRMLIECSELVTILVLLLVSSWANKRRSTSTGTAPASLTIGAVCGPALHKSTKSQDANSTNSLSRLFKFFTNLQTFNTLCAALLMCWPLLFILAELRLRENCCR